MNEIIFVQEFDAVSFCKKCNEKFAHGFKVYGELIVARTGKEFIYTQFLIK